MLSRPTVFVVGAGAGVDIGMPTGSVLIEEIARKVNWRIRGQEMETGDEELYQSLRSAAAQTKMPFNELLRAGRSIAQGVSYTRSIDSYIHTHSTDEAIKLVGKIAIVDTILKFERTSALFVDTTKAYSGFRDASKTRESWMHDFMYVLSENVSAKANLKHIFKNLTIINFNYDRCIEQFLHRALQELFLVDRQTSAELVNGADIFHPYGKLADLPWQSRENIEYGGDPFGNPIDLGVISRNIRTFNEEVDATDQFEETRNRLIEAEKIIFLGFHFHRQNMEILRSNSPKRTRSSSYILASTYGRSEPDTRQIESRIRSLFGESGLGPSVNLLPKTCKQLLVDYAAALSW